MSDNSFKSSSEKGQRVKKIIKQLNSEFQISVPSSKKPFLTLVRTVLSQNTNRQNTRKAYENLTPKYDTPSKIVEIEKEKLENLIRPAGLYKSKAETLKNLAKIIQNEFEGNLEKILKKPLDEAREKLLEMQGVGPKTADCVLLFAGGCDVLPVDTHVDRTSKRLGLVDLGSSVEGVKDELESIIPEGERGRVHLLLIELGREYCKARSPDCMECLIKDLCPQVGVD